MKSVRRMRLSGRTLRLSLIALITIGLLLFRLGSMLPGLAGTETGLPPAKTSLDNVWSQPLEAPLHIARLLIAVISPSTGVAISRLPNVLIGLAICLLMYWLIKRWYGTRLALFGMVLLITAPWFLHVSRLATSDVLYPLGMAIVIALATLWHQKQWHSRIFYISVLLIAAIAYIPGMFWLLLVVAVFERRQLIQSVKAAKKHAALAVTLLLVLLVPLLRGVVVMPEIGRRLLGSGTKLPEFTTFGMDFLRSWQYLFLGGFDDSVRNLAGLPLANAFLALAFIIGVALYAKHPKATRTKQLLGLWIVGTALVALGGPVSLSLLMPIVVVLAVGGIGYLLHLWLKTFPRNPYARYAGIGLLGLVVAFAVAYNVRSYFVAWPKAPATKAAFTRQN